MNRLRNRCCNYCDDCAFFNISFVVRNMKNTIWTCCNHFENAESDKKIISYLLITKECLLSIGLNKPTLRIFREPLGEFDNDWIPYSIYKNSLGSLDGLSDDSLDDLCYFQLCQSGLGIALVKFKDNKLIKEICLVRDLLGWNLI